MRGIVIALCLILSVGPVTAGCHRTTRVTTYETDGSYASPPVTKQETTTEVDTGDKGVLASVVEVIGDVIAIPFRLVGGLIDLIF